MTTGATIDFFPAKDGDGTWSRCANARHLDDDRIEAVIDECIAYFRDLGGIVPTRHAVRHNILAWLADYKSGYRDEEAGCHLFTPCGCNPLRISLSKLDEECRGWQTTFEY